MDTIGDTVSIGTLKLQIGLSFRIMLCVVYKANKKNGQWWRILRIE